LFYPRYPFVSTPQTTISFNYHNILLSADSINIFQFHI
jgi:hypothetical protein